MIELVSAYECLVTPIFYQQRYRNFIREPYRIVGWSREVCKIAVIALTVQSQNPFGRDIVRICVGEVSRQVEEDCAESSAV